MSEPVEVENDLFALDEMNFICLDEKKPTAEEIYENLLKKLDENGSGNGYLHSQLGNICKEGLADYEKALEHYLLSLEMFCQEISPLDKRLRNVYLSIAHILLLQGQNPNGLAIEYFQRILSIDNSTENVNEENLINDHNYLALLYQNEKNFPAALFHLKKCLQSFLLIHSGKNKSDENFYFSDHFVSETIYDEKALKSLSIDKLPDLSELHLNLATVYQKLGKKENAVKYAQRALQLSLDDQKKFETYQTYFHKLQLN